MTQPPTDEDLELDDPDESFPDVRTDAVPVQPDDPQPSPDDPAPKPDAPEGEEG